MSPEALRRQVWTALLAALIAVGAYLHFPIGAAPFSMQPFFILLAGLILGPWQGAVCMGLYLAAGFIGLPVYAGGGSGLAHLLGPTGGYLAGFLGTAALAGVATMGRGARLGWGRGLLWTILAIIPAYVLGVIRLKFVLDMGWEKAFAVGAAPFILFDLVKCALAVAVYNILQRRGVLPPAPSRNADTDDMGA